VDEVQIPWEPIAMTGIRATELERIAGISFQKSFDDLDERYFAILESAGDYSGGASSLV